VKAAQLIKQAAPNDQHVFVRLRHVQKV
jgi:hypothetical protein